MQQPPVKMLRERSANDTKSRKLPTTTCWPCFLLRRGKPQGCSIDRTGTTLQSSNSLRLAILHVSHGGETKTPRTTPAIMARHRAMAAPLLASWSAPCTRSNTQTTGTTLQVLESTNFCICSTMSPGLRLPRKATKKARWGEKVGGRETRSDKGLNSGLPKFAPATLANLFCSVPLG